MSANLNKIGYVLCLAAGSLAVQVAAAQTRVGTNAPAAAMAARQTPNPEAMFARWDTDANKSLSLDEFNAGWQEVQAAMALRKLHDTFVAMDINKNGSLDATEYANLALIKQTGSAAPSMTVFDGDKNHLLDFREYVALVQSMLKQPH